MLERLNIFIVSIAIVLMFSSPVFAESTMEDFEVWGNVTAIGSLAPVNQNLKNFRFWLEGQGRFGNDASQFSQSLMRPGVGYAVNDKTTVWLGYAWAPTAQPFALKHPFNEHRIWQQVLWADNFSFGRVTSRSRLEQRFFDESAPGDSDVAHRFRQFFKLAVPMPFVSPKVSFIIQDEIFVNLTNTDRGIFNGFDQNRIFSGLAYRFNQIVTGEVGYMNQYYNRPHSARPDQMVHILGVNLFLNY
ncbi:MAG: DUF2490 domain-containing protein [Nitrosomonas sp.]|nr:DUF2490 domain-containing protein [Nitrosomonas sp.]MDP1949849.1 DUF2490 domain-containing protein [Nitrosomonas sp.]